MIEYQKIETPYERDMGGSKKLIVGQFRDKAVEFLQDAEWVGTEKIDGTNIGVVWDGHSVAFQGRTEKAQIPAVLVNRLNELFGGETNAQMFEQMFGENQVVLFGEGFGKKIQKVGAEYLPDGVDFILFDIYFPEKDLWLERDNMLEIAQAFNIKVVPVVFCGPIYKAVEFVKAGYTSTIGTAKMEGLVLKPEVELRDRRGNRIVIKVKARDFE